MSSVIGRFSCIVRKWVRNPWLLYHTEDFDSRGCFVCVLTARRNSPVFPRTGTRTAWLDTLTCPSLFKCLPSWLMSPQRVGGSAVCLRTCWLHTRIRRVKKGNFVNFLSLEGTVTGQTSLHLYFYSNITEYQQTLHPMAAARV